jgi:hypothetical protein
MGMRGDYFVSRKISTSPFTSSVLNEIIPRYLLPSPHFLPKSKTLQHTSVYLEEGYLRELGEHQIPSHPHSHWKKKYKGSKQDLNIFSITKGIHDFDLYTKEILGVRFFFENVHIMDV